MSVCSCKYVFNYVFNYVLVVVKFRFSRDLFFSVSLYGDFFYLRCFSVYIKELSLVILGLTHRTKVLQHLFIYYTTHSTHFFKKSIYDRVSNEQSHYLITLPRGQRPQGGGLGKPSFEGEWWWWWLHRIIRKKVP